MKYVFTHLIPNLFYAIIRSKITCHCDKTKEMKKQAGFVNYYWEDATGKIWMECKKQMRKFYTNNRCLLA